MHIHVHTCTHTCIKMHAHTYTHVCIDAHTHTNLLFNSPQVPLKLPLQISWRRGPDMPFGMSGYIQSVVVEGTVYVGGGDAGLGSDNSYIVMTYDISTGKWATLPPYRTWGFAMTAINNQLVLVGGKSGHRMSKVGVLNVDNKQWTHPYPEMHTARSCCSVVVHNEWLVVAGGESTDEEDISSVEVMNTNSKQWYAGPPTPTPWSFMRTTVVGDICYFMGGLISLRSTDKVYTVSLSALTSGLIPKEPGNIWKEIPGLYLDSTPLSIRGSLFAVGGKKERFKLTTAIHLYQPDTEKWVKVGDLSTPRRDCICEKITDKEMLVAGGGDGRYTLKSTYMALLK